LATACRRPSCAKTRTQSSAPKCRGPGESVDWVQESGGRPIQSRVFRPGYEMCMVFCSPHTSTEDLPPIGWEQALLLHLGFLSQDSRFPTAWAMEQASQSVAMVACQRRVRTWREGHTCSAGPRHSHCPAEMQASAIVSCQDMLRHAHRRKAKTGVFGAVPEVAVWGQAQAAQARSRGGADQLSTGLKDATRSSRAASRRESPRVRAPSRQ